MSDIGNPFAELTRLRAINAELLAALEDIEGKCADAIGGRINYRAGDLQIIAREAIVKDKGSRTFLPST